MVIWLIGLSGSGKSTIGQAVYRQWKMVTPNTVLLDGDQIREIFDHNRQQSDYSLEGRKLNAERVIKLCQMLDEQNINVVCCLLSVFEEHRKWCRKHFRQYIEVFVDVPFQTLVTRDNKQLYQRALDGKIKNVVGVDIPFPSPEKADLVIHNTFRQQDITDYVHQVMQVAGIPYESD